MEYGVPTKIWHHIAGMLPPPSLRNFMRTHRHAKNSVSQDQIDQMNHWDLVFKDYSWVDEVTSCGSMPVLFRQEEKPHIYLFLTETKDKKARNPALLSLIKNSLRSEKLGEKPYEIDFTEFTLNISNIMWPGVLIKTPGFEWFLKEKKIQVALYGNGIHQIKVKVFGGQMAIVELPKDKGMATFADEDIFPDNCPVYGEDWPSEQS